MQFYVCMYNIMYASVMTKPQHCAKRIPCSPSRVHTVRRLGQNGQNY